MKKRIFSLIAVLVMTLSLPAHAATTYAPSVQPYLSFDGTTAKCSVNFIGDNSTDKATLTLTLYQGSTYVASWTSSGTGRASISKTCEVESGKSYKLALAWSVNGKSQPSLSATKTCP